MFRITTLAIGLVALAASVAQAQIVIDASPVVTSYYSPSPVVSYYGPTVSAPVVTYSAPTTAFYGPAVAAPITSYYAPVTTTFYGGTTVAAPVVAPPVVVGRPVVVGSSAYGTLRPYVYAQPVRNTVRYFVP